MKKEVTMTNNCILFASSDWEKPREGIHVGPSIDATWQLY
jgi:hypothetical protein